MNATAGVRSEFVTVPRCSASAPATLRATPGTAADAKLADYLDRLDGSGCPPGDGRIRPPCPGNALPGRLPQRGAPTLTTTPAHTRAAREILGPGRYYLPPTQSRVSPILCMHDRSAADGPRSLPFCRGAFTRTTCGARGSPRRQLQRRQRRADRLPCLHGTPGRSLDGLRRPPLGGADHICIQVVASPGQTPMASFRARARHLPRPQP